jgi:hypothetical protein
MLFRSYIDDSGREVTVRPAGVSGFCAWAAGGNEVIRGIAAKTKWKSLGCFGHTQFDAQRALDQEAYRRCWEPLP